MDIPCGKIPHTYVPVTATRNEKIAPWYHGPDPHNVALKRLLMLPVDVEDVDFGVVECNDNILVGQMQTGDDALFRRDLPGIAMASRPPCRLDHVSLLEMRAVCCCLRPTPGQFSLCSTIQTLCSQRLGPTSRRSRYAVRLPHGGIAVSRHATRLQPLRHLSLVHSVFFFDPFFF